MMAVLLYGAGLRVLECCRLRVKDVDFASDQIIVRCGKGQKDRVTLLPASVKSALACHSERVRKQHVRDLSKGAGWVELPDAVGRKYPNAGREWGWQWLFPATRMYTDRATAQRRRHHFHESALQRAVKVAVMRAGLVKLATCHTLPSLLRDPSSGRRQRHPNGAEAARTQGRKHDHDLHPCHAEPLGRRPQPGRPPLRRVIQSATPCALHVLYRQLPVSLSTTPTANPAAQFTHPKPPTATDLPPPPVLHSLSPAVQLTAIVLSIPR